MDEKKALELTEKERKEQLEKMWEFAKELPDNIIQAVPDDVVVTIPISGAFFRAMGKSLDYLMTTQKVEEVIRAAEYIKLDYKGDNIDMDLVTDFDTAVWTMSHLISEFNTQALLQKKAVEYDKTAYFKVVEDNQANPLKPLTTKEIEKRQEMLKLAKEKEEKEKGADFDIDKEKSNED